MKLTDAELVAELEGRAQAFAGTAVGLTPKQAGALLDEMLRADVALLLPELADGESAKAAQINRALRQIRLRDHRKSRTEIGYLKCWGQVAIGLASRQQKPVADLN